RCHYHCCPCWPAPSSERPWRKKRSARPIHEYREGAAAETIRQNFPTLFLEQIHGAIAYYLGHQQEAETYLPDLEKKWDELERAKPASPEIQQRIQEARKHKLAKLA